VGIDTEMAPRPTPGPRPRRARVPTTAQRLHRHRHRGTPPLRPATTRDTPRRHRLRSGATGRSMQALQPPRPATGRSPASRRHQLVSAFLPYARSRRVADAPGASTGQPERLLPVPKPIPRRGGADGSAPFSRPDALRLDAWGRLVGRPWRRHHKDAALAAWLALAAGGIRARQQDRECQVDTPAKGASGSGNRGR
jgi:hypothetical protein